MGTRPLILIAVVILLLAGCASTGYNRPYIITDTTDEEVISESIEKPR
jgi:hypothetical protein